MDDNLREQLAFLPEYLRGHLVLTVAAIVTSILVSVPLGLAATRNNALKRTVLAVCSIVQTIPSLALLALMLALLGGQIGFAPAFVALVLYSMLPIVRNTVTGIETVPADAVEAAHAIGMTPRQVLLQVQLPLALHVIIAGIRTATVWTVGLATLSTLVGATSLGNYIFIGIQTRNLTAVTLGSICSAILAIILDSAVGGIQWLAQRSGRHRVAWSVAGVVTILAAMGVAWAALAKPKADFVVGGKGFTEQYILVELIAGELERAGYRVERRPGLGSDMVHEATRNGSVDVFVEYSGTVWANHMMREDNPGRDAVFEETIAWMAEHDNIVTLGASGFENLYAFAMRRDRAQALGVESIEDLAPHARSMKCGADLEFFGRPEWIRVREAYRIDFDEKLTFDAALMYTAVHEEQVDVITAYTTDGRVAAYDLFLLDDPREALLPYDALLVASERAAAIPGFRNALEPLVDAIDDETMRMANKMVDVDGQSVGEAAAFLRDHIRR